jgi:hypothetical protein
VDDTVHTVGALASSSGLTVRTLHHWDAIGPALTRLAWRERREGDGGAGRLRLRGGRFDAVAVGV